MVNPVDGRIAFILGPEDPTPDWQYCAWHRRGVLLDPERPGEIANLDARDVSPPFTPGALRGGSHVHQFSPDGRLVSFTYEDHVLATVAAQVRDADASLGETRQQLVDLNQRNVAVASPRPVQVPRTHPRNHDGEYYSVVVTCTVNDPRPGSDEISRAYEEAWLAGPRPALAFLGDVVALNGISHAELFVVELPADLTKPGDGPLEGTPTRRPAPPAGTRQRRLTFTSDRPCPGLQGPRFWPRGAPDGSLIAFLMLDDQRRPQLWLIAPRGGEPRQLTHDPFPVASALTWNPDGSQIAYIADGSVMTVDVVSGRTRRLTPSRPGMRPEVCVYSPDGEQIAYVQQVAEGSRAFNQVFVAEL
jgi:dipeptidyl aminopeptidase/acylaminoacyl peptidase